MDHAISQQSMQVEQLVQQSKFAKAFAYVKSRLPVDKSVTIGASLGCFASPTISDELKSELGLMIIAMIVNQKDTLKLKIPTSALKQIIEKVIEDMPTD
jgi:hypothetical protein